MGKRAARDPHSQIDQILGARIRALREAKGWTARDLASRVGVSYQQIQKYENGQNRISAYALLDIANQLGTPVGPLFEGLPALIRDTSETAELSGRIARLLARPNAGILLDQLLDLPEPAWTALGSFLSAAITAPDTATEADQSGD